MKLDLIWSQQNSKFFDVITILAAMLVLQDTEQLKFDTQTSTELCISTDGTRVFMDTCDPLKDSQKWTFSKVDFSLFKPDLGPPYDRSLEQKPS